MQKKTINAGRVDGFFNDKTKGYLPNFIKRYPSEN